MEIPLYDEMFKDEAYHWWFKARREIIIYLLQRFGLNDPDMKILDIGCGCGYNALFFLKVYKTVIGLDASDEALRFCQKRRIMAIKGKLPHNIPLRKNSFDAVMLMDVLEHIKDDSESLKITAGLLKAGGLVLATVPAHQFLWTHRDEYYHHHKRYSKHQYEKIFDIPQLEKLLLSYFNIFLFLPFIISRLASKIFKFDKMEPDLHIPPPPVNYLLEKIFASEKFLLGKIPFITGASLIAVYRKK